MRERFDRNPAAIATTLGLVVLALVLSTQFLPWLTREGDVVSSTPVRADLAVVQPIVLQAGQRACLDDVTFDPSTQLAQLTIARTAPGGTRLSVQAAGDGYRATATTRVPALYGGLLDVPFAAPSEPVAGTLCVHNAGERTVELAGTADARALTRSTVTLDGQPLPQGFSLTLREADRRSLLDRVPQLVDRVAALSALGPWLVWLLIPLLLVGVPACVIVALHLALREADPAPPDSGA